MKTTLDISTPLLERIKRLAAREKTTIRALVEEGLGQVLADRGKRGPFKLRDASVGGKGLQPGVELGNWDQMRSLIYGDGRFP